MTDVAATVDGGTWQDVTACPACGHAAGEKVRLFNQRFYLHDLPAPAPHRPVNLVRCADCTLVYKDVVPSPALLSSLTEQVQGGVWQSTYDYADEVSVVRRLTDGNAPDLLDIGAAGGEFLRAVPTDGRKSALDIVQFDGLQVSGEFITGFLDTPDLRWSGQPYDVVAAFDVLEHLYDPPSALANLARFVAPAGHIVVETGDSDAAPGRALAKWYYLNGIDHHLAWNARSFERAAAAAGLEVVEFVRKPHKLDAALPGSGLPKLKAWAFGLFPRAYRALYARLRRPLSIPHLPGRADHFRAILKRRPA